MRAHCCLSSTFAELFLSYKDTTPIFCVVWSGLVRIYTIPYCCTAFVALGVSASHMKFVRFFVPQNMKEVYNATFQAFPEEIRSAHDGDVLSYLNGSLDVLDLGCGTGLIGSWFKDYARKLVGVDVSPTMLDMATKKGCYHELRRGVSKTNEEWEAASDVTNPVVSHVCI